MDTTSTTVNGRAVTYDNVETVDFTGGAGNDRLRAEAADRNNPAPPVAVQFNGGAGDDVIDVRTPRRSISPGRRQRPAILPEEIPNFVRIDGGAGTTRSTGPPRHPFQPRSATRHR